MVQALPVAELKLGNAFNGDRLAEAWECITGRGDFQTDPKNEDRTLWYVDAITFLTQPDILAIAHALVAERRGG